MQPPPDLSSVSQPIAASLLPQLNYTEQFAKNKDDFLKGQSLRDWEQAALRSYAKLVQIRLILGVFFVLVALDAVFRTILLTKVPTAWKAGMVVDLAGFVVVGVFALITLFKLRWWMLLTAAIAIIPFNYSSTRIGMELFNTTTIALFPCVLGYTVAIIMLFMIACAVGWWRVNRANRGFCLSPCDFDAIKLAFSEIATGRQAELWPQIGEIHVSFGDEPVRVRFFDNGALFFLGKNPLHIVLNNDAQKCVVEVTKKNKKFIKQWPAQGKVLPVNIALTDVGHTRLKEWLNRVATPAVVANA